MLREQQQCFDDKNKLSKNISIMVWSMEVYDLYGLMRSLYFFFGKFDKVWYLNDSFLGN